MTTPNRPLAALALLALLLSGLAWAPAGVAAASWAETGPLPPWDPATMATYPGAKLGDFTATPLSNGLVLAIGGFSVPAAAVYNQPTDNWVATAPPARPRYRHTATLLANGQVLIVGGWSPCCVAPLGSADAERFDPTVNIWTPAAPLAEPRANHTATLLDDGSVLIVGGDAGGTAERYDPATDRWSPAGQPGAARRGHTATMLHDGTVLVVGGGAGDTGLASAARYDPKTNAWTPAAPLAIGRYGHSATMLTDGTVVVAGGRRDNATTEASVERYDPVADAWGPLPALNRARVGHGAALVNGQLVVVGGETAGPAPTAERFDPRSDGVCFVETGRCLRGAFLDYWRANGGLARNGFPLSGEFAERLEDGWVYRVQYFERARFEHHPENPAPTISSSANSAAASGAAASDGFLTQSRRDAEGDGEETV